MTTTTTATTPPKPQPALHCTFCGSAFAPEQQSWPRTCRKCGRVTYKNPLPVAVVLQPVTDDGGRVEGLLTIRRTIDPGRGKLALPGGFIDINDASWQHAAAREVREELGLTIRPEDVSVYRVLSAPDKTLLLFCAAKPLRRRDLPAFQATNETSELVVLTAPQELAFPLHTRVVGEWFAEKLNDQAWRRNPNDQTPMTKPQ